MEIKEIKSNKKQYIDLLLLADEQESMIDRYLERGIMYILIDKGKVRSECVITVENGNTVEIKNIATYPEDQGKGYAKHLINFIAKKYQNKYQILQVGTGDSPLTIPFMKNVVLNAQVRSKIFL